MIVQFIIIAISVVTFILIFRNFNDLKKHDEGTAEMAELASILRSGAKTFMRREYRVIIPTVLIVALAYSLFMEVASGLSFIFGALMSSLAVTIGMRGGTYGNVRTTNAARVTGAMSRTVRIALMSGSISGYSVPAFGAFGAAIVWIVSGGINPSSTSHGLVLDVLCNPLTMRLTTYSLGCSVVAMFNRVAGGNYTKAADISADIVGKNVHGLPEDDARMPNTLADFIGDLVNDIAGNVSDLLESFVATPVSTILVAMQEFKENIVLLNAACMYPFVLVGGGLLSSIIGVNYIILKNRKQIKIIDGKEVEVSREDVDPAEELDHATYLSALVVALIGLLSAKFIFGEIELSEHFRFGWISPWLAAVLGMISSVAIGKLTEYYTSFKYHHVKRLAYMAKEGVAYEQTEGDAVGKRSVMAPCIIIVLSILISCIACGTYGIAIAAVGVLSFVGTTVSIDAFGPVADNAGGIAESCHLDPKVRRITDELDAVGNTTAAIGKGNAIGAAAFATVSLVMSYIGSYNISRYFDTPQHVTMSITTIIGGAIIGAGLIDYFSSILGHNTIEAAKKLADEGERQLKVPGVIEGTKRPDYEYVITMAADEALHYMLTPSVIALVVPLCGFILGPNFILGILCGAIVAAIKEALFMGNSGGAWDNAKKMWEANMVVLLGEDGEPVYDGDGNLVVLSKNDIENAEAYKAAVACDTMGDTRKDVIGVALDIFIKIMSTESNTLAPLFAAYSLF
ncbi:sodium/proton-translocating pyrophosphatase [Candidatus Saccharibacteria bacterium]|nr:sodium/proton-translocating pyrophosphatase [Candidatus Saccharibacteria bacterium]